MFSSIERKEVDLIFYFRHGGLHERSARERGGEGERERERGRGREGERERGRGRERGRERRGWGESGRRAIRCQSASAMRP